MKRADTFPPDRRIALLVLAAAIAVAAAPSAWAANLYCVKPGGVDGCQSSIQAAIDAVASQGVPGIIDVHPGTYSENLVIPDVVATVRGVGDAPQQVIDGSLNASQPVVYAASFNAPRPIRLTLEKLSMTGGSGIAMGQGQLTLKRCRVHGNTGRGVSVGAKATIIDSEIFDNTAASGAGLYVGWHAWVVMKGTTIRDNVAEYHGGGALVYGGRLDLENSTISGNSAFQGGGIYATLTNGNFPTFPRLKARYSTIAHNTAELSAGGLKFDYIDRGRILFQGTILGDNDAPEDPDCYSDFGQARILDRGSILIENLGSCLVLAHPTSLFGVDPLLGPLGDNGGPTQTQALLPGSPAKGAARTACPRTDQRGIRRSRPCSIGAVD